MPRHSTTNPLLYVNWSISDGGQVALFNLCANTKQLKFGLGYLSRRITKEAYSIDSQGRPSIVYRPSPIISFLSFLRTHSISLRHVSQS